MHPDIRRLRRAAGQAIWQFREICWYAQHKLWRTSYADYYARRMDHIVRRNANWGLNLDRRFQLEFLTRHGLSKQSMFLDYGCGALSAGIHFIEYLDEGCYCGVDISREAVAEGIRRIIAIHKLGAKRPQVHVIRGTSLEVLGDKRFDVIWAQSVLTHMPPEDIGRLLQELRGHMHPTSNFYATFARTDGKSHSKGFKDWYHPREFFVEQGRSHGYAVAFLAEWHHPDDPDGLDTLVRFAPN